MSRARLLLLPALGIALVAGVAAGSADGSRQRRAQPAPQVRPTFVVTGRGWGHGVGLAQWGAYGFARQGDTYDEILAHYYPGTSLGPAPVTRVRVLLAQGKRSLTIASAAPFRVRDGSGQTYDLPAGPQTFGPGLRLKPKDATEKVQLSGPLLFLPGVEPLRLGRPYRGQLQVTVVNGRLRAVNSVPLESYLYGVVPSEMPHTWLPEALKAQAVAARTYALAVRRTGSDFDLFPDTRSQVYGGISSEKTSTTAAVDETAGEVVLYRGQIAKTYFFSSSGGRTAAANEVWPNSPPIPYLVSVDDPYDSISPHHQWGPFTIGTKRLARAVRSRGRLVDVRTTNGPSGRVQTVTAVGVNGEASVTGADVRRALKLRSTWFRIGVLSLSPPTAPATYGARVSLSGLARSLPQVALEQRQAGGAWRQVAPIAPGPGGAVTVATRPREPTDYRLVSGSARSTPAHVAVAPLVRFYGLEDPSTLRGYARPLFPGASVVVQRLRDDAWTTVSRATIDASGDFQARLTLAPGSYRARLRPGRGFALGVSPVLRVGAA